MLKRFLPKESGFFYLFQKSADLIEQSTARFHILLQHLDQPQHHVDAIAEFEGRGDEVAFQTFELLHKTFITPFDRHDIHQLTNGLDDVLDLVNRCAQRFPFYALMQVPQEMINLAEISVQASVKLKEVIYRINALDKAPEILEFCLAIDNSESEAHRIVLAGEKKLYAEEQDFKHFFKLKDIYAQTKLVINRIQDVGNMIKGIIFEYT